MADIPARFPPRILDAVQSAALIREGLDATVIGGFNPDVDMQNFEDIWVPGGVRPWLSTAAPLVARSTDAGDTAAGSGARKLLLTGLDSSGAVIAETIEMAGTSNSTPTTQSFFRQNNALVIEVGAYRGTNLGDITIETSPGAVLQSFIRIGSCRQEQTHFTIPANASALFFSATAAIAATKPAIVRIKELLNAGQVTPPFAGVINLFEFPGVEGVVPIRLIVPLALDGFTDIWFEAQGSGQNSTIQIAYSLMFVAN